MFVTLADTLKHHLFLIWLAQVFALLQSSLTFRQPAHIITTACFEIVKPGWYGVLVTSTHNDTGHYKIDVEPVLPDSGLFAFGLATMFLGFVLIATSRILERSRSFYYVEQSTNH